ncbi:rieske domain-containing protein [Plectosphaerella plurivora]|uniref:Rieske domain-containing protein n=1 Tax=Plectosphaerella plurivora TaxID=936078 RepID=A0A9P8V5T6_9PEZI|nr:rieske domain-containing protein [Plectosphaerella plurivora]
MSWNIFGGFGRKDAGWFSVGLASTFPNLGDDANDVLHKRPCGGPDGEVKRGCKVFQSPPDTAQGDEVPVPDDDTDFFPTENDLADQVLVFQYRGKFHAVDHRCPHSSYPLSRGMPFDIEDFGVVLSAGITCPKHGWSFDLFTGNADRASYRLKVWEVQLRDVQGLVATDAVEGEAPPPQKEVWVRRKQRIG